MKKIRGNSGNHRIKNRKSVNSFHSEERISENELLREHKDIFKTILERVSDAFVSLDLNWNYTYMNKKAGEIFNRNPEEMIGKHIWTEFPEGIDQPFYKAYYKAIETQQFIKIEDYYPPYNKWFENNIYPSKDGLSIYFNDITERKEEEEQIRITNKRLQKAQELGNMGYWELNVSADTIWGSDQAMKIFGFHTGAREIPIKEIEPLIPEIEKIRKANYDLIKYGTKYELEVVINPADGSNQKYISAIGEYQKKPTERQGRVMGVLKDITEHKIAEEKILYALKKVNAIVESISDGFFTVNKNWDVTYWNKEAEKMLGTQWKNSLDKNLWEMLKDKTSPNFYSQLHKSMEENCPVQFEEFYAFTEVWIKVNVYPAEDKLSIFFQNITEAKRQEKLNILEKDSLEYYALKNPSLEEFITFLLNGLRNIHPSMLCSVLKIKDGKLYNWSSPHLPEAYNQKVEGTEIGVGHGSCGSAAFLRSKVEVENILIDPYWKDYLEIIKNFPMKSCWSYPIIDSKNNLLGTFGIYHNTVKYLSKSEEQSIQRVRTILIHIIEKKLSENEAKEFRDKLELIFNATNDVVFLISIENASKYKFVTINKPFLQATGLTRDKVEGKYVHEVIPSSSYSLVVSKYQQAIKEGETVSWEETSEYPSGIKTGLVSISPVYNEYGECTNLVGTVHDITHRKKYEEKIKQAYEELRTRNDELREKNKKLEDIAWVQSHKVRAPLARIMGLVNLLAYHYTDEMSINELLKYVSDSAKELDAVIKEILKKTEENDAG